MKKILSIFLVILSVFMICSTVIAADKPTLPGWNEQYGDPIPPKLKGTMEGAWGTIATLVQILSAACFVFAGVRYMFASADQKADIKRGMIYLFVGAFIVFGATTIIKMVASAAEKVID